MSDAQALAAFRQSRKLSKHRMRYAHRKYATKGAAYQMGYLVGYATAFQWWHRQVYGYERGRQ